MSKKTPKQASGWSHENNGFQFNGYWINGYVPPAPNHFADLDNQICAGHKDKNGIYDAQHGVAPGDDGKLFLVWHDYSDTVSLILSSSTQLLVRIRI